MLLSHGLALKPHFHTRMVDNLDNSSNVLCDFEDAAKNIHH